MTRPTLFLLHALGGSAAAWAGVSAALGADYDCVALDLPGFGDNAGDARITVAEMLDWLSAEIVRRQPAAYLLVGHSMGGKLATLTAARAAAGAPGMSALAGVVLLAASPPSPEPMAEDRRAEMLGWAIDGPVDEAAARTFVEANIAAPLPPEQMAGAMAGVRRSGPHAWRGWLERGSREDWSGDVPKLAMPATIVAGADDGDLGEEAQRALNLPFYPAAKVEVVTGAAHLLPLEQPGRVADLIAATWARAVARILPAEHARLIGSPRVSQRTRAALFGRVHAVAPPDVLGDDRRRLLTAMLGRLLPHGDPAIDLAAALDAELATGPGDGWRLADLPPDADAWRAGLDSVATLAPGFGGLAADEQDALLAEWSDGKSDVGAEAPLAPGLLRLWLEDVRGAAVRAWLAHPATMARIGYDGFANGGDGPRLEGYSSLGADQLDRWQLQPAGPRA